MPITPTTVEVGGWHRGGCGAGCRGVVVHPPQVDDLMDGSYRQDLLLVSAVFALPLLYWVAAAAFRKKAEHASMSPITKFFLWFILTLLFQSVVSGAAGMRRSVFCSSPRVAKACDKQGPRPESLSLANWLRSDW